MQVAPEISRARVHKVATQWRPETKYAGILAQKLAHQGLATFAWYTVKGFFVLFSFARSALKHYCGALSLRVGFWWLPPNLTHVPVRVLSCIGLGLYSATNKAILSILFKLDLPLSCQLSGPVSIL